MQIIWDVVDKRIWLFVGYQGRFHVNLFGQIISLRGSELQTSHK